MTTRFTDPAQLWSRPPDGGPPELVHEHLADVAGRAAALITPNQQTPTGEPLRPVAAVLGWAHDFGKLTEWFQSAFDERAADVGRREPYTYHSLLGAILAHYALDCRGYDVTTRSVGFHATVAHHRATADVQSETSRYADTRQSVQNRLDRVGDQCDNIAARLPNYADRIVRTATAGQGSLNGFASYLSDQTFMYDLTRLKNRTPQSAYSLLVLLTGVLKLADRSTVLERAFRPHDGTASEQLSPALRRELPPAGIVEREIEQLGDESPASELDCLRTVVQYQTRDRALERARATDGGFLGTIQLPTGFGKTHAGLWAGLELAAEAAGSDRADDRSLVYVLPYTSIVDQTAETIRDVYSRVDRADSLLVDHYLEQTRVDIDTDRAAGDDDATVPAQFFLGRSWRANTVLSTFVQLFESLAGPTSNQAPKLPSLQESVIVIDEPQLLSAEWWPLVGRLADLLVDQFDATVLSMTATQPRIFEQTATNDVTPLVTHDDGPLDFLEENPRVVYEIDHSVDGVGCGAHAETAADSVTDSHSGTDVETGVRGGDTGPETAASRTVGGSETGANGGPISHDEAAERVVEELDGGSGLVVCNTIDSARQFDTELTRVLTNRGESVVSLGECLHEWVTETGSYPDGVDACEQTAFETFLADRTSETDILTVHLTSAIRPPDRLRLVSLLRESAVVRETGVVCTATQVVEAGVDLSFDRVYRDLAPVPSLVQSGGRCNRSLESDGSRTVTVWRLASPPLARSDRPPATVIYRRSVDRLTPTVRSLPYTATDRSVGEAVMIGPVVDEFYRRVHEIDPGDRSLVDAVDRSASETLRAASLIADRDDEVELLLARTDHEHQLLTRLRTAVEEETWDEVQALFSESQSLRFSVADRRVDTLASTSAAETVTVFDSRLCLVDGTTVPDGFDTHLGVVNSVNGPEA